MTGAAAHGNDRPQDQKLLKVMLFALGFALAAGVLVLILPVIRTVGPSGQIEYAPPIETAGFRTILTNLFPATVSAIAVTLRRWRSARLLASLALVYFALYGLVFVAGLFFIPAAVLQVIAVFLPYRSGDRHSEAASPNGR